MATPRVRALLVDLDDTLVDSTAAYDRALAQIGMPPGSPQHGQFAAARRQVKARLPLGHVVARNRLLYFKQQAGAAPFVAAAVLQRMAAYETALQQELAQQWQRLQRKSLMLALAARFRVIVVTNENTRTQLLKMAVLDPDGSWCRALVTSEEIGVEKPHLSMLEAACAAAGVAPKACMMVGDSLDHDIVSARQLGCAAALTTEFWPRPQKPPSLPPAVRLLSSLDALPQLLR